MNHEKHKRHKDPNVAGCERGASTCTGVGVTERYLERIWIAEGGKYIQIIISCTRHHITGLPKVSGT